MSIRFQCVSCGTTDIVYSSAADDRFVVTTTCDKCTREENVAVVSLTVSGPTPVSENE